MLGPAEVYVPSRFVVHPGGGGILVWLSHITQDWWGFSLILLLGWLPVNMGVRTFFSRRVHLVLNRQMTLAVDIVGESVLSLSLSCSFPIVRRLLLFCIIFRSLLLFDTFFDGCFFFCVSSCCHSRALSIGVVLCEALYWWALGPSWQSAVCVDANGRR